MVRMNVMYGSEPNRTKLWLMNIHVYVLQRLRNVSLFSNREVNNITFVR